MQEEQKTQVPETNQPIANVATKEKMSKKQIIGMTILSLIALAGVAFGIFGITDSNSKNQEIERLKVQITEASGQKTKLETDQITITDPDGTTTEITDTVSSYRNPVIKSPGTDADGYTVTYSSSFQSSIAENNKVVLIGVSDGKVSSCKTGTQKSEYSGYSISDMYDCNITGLSGDIYKIIEFGEGHSNSEDSIGFIMTDGTVQYFPLFDAIKNNDFSIKGKLRLNGYVTDAIEIGVGVSKGEEGSGYGSTVFILNDGSVIKYEKAQLAS